MGAVNFNGGSYTGGGNGFCVTNDNIAKYGYADDIETVSDEGMCDYLNDCMNDFKFDIENRIYDLRSDVIKNIISKEIVLPYNLSTKRGIIYTGLSLSTLLTRWVQSDDYNDADKMLVIHDGYYEGFQVELDDDFVYDCLINDISVLSKIKEKINEIINETLHERFECN